jgi:hypothetical protein
MKPNNANIGRSPTMQRWFAIDCITRLHHAHFIRVFKNGNSRLTADGRDWVRRVNGICHQFGFRNHDAVSREFKRQIKKEQVTISAVN